MSRERFGSMTDGSQVERVEIEGSGLVARIITWGAVIQDLRLAGHASPLVLGFNEFAYYPAHSPYFGATVGRFANRIAHGRFAIDGVTYQGEINFLGKHTLHGGSTGIGRRNWTIAKLQRDRVTLTLVDRDGEMGFPGTCLFSVTYGVLPDGVLEIVMEGTTDRPTLVNLAHHSYFDLDGSGDIRDHHIAIHASRYLPVDDELIPTGQILPVAGTAHDFTKSRPIRLEKDGAATGYDNNYCLGNTRVPVREAAVVSAPKSGITMKVRTTEPGIQFYSGHRMSTPVPGLTGKPYANWSGLCLEPQIWPDAPNHPDFPQAILRPGQTYRQVTEYCFSRA